MSKQIKNPWDEFDEFDLAEALDLWLQHNWTGQTCPKYMAHCQLTEIFKRGIGISEMNEPQQWIYDELTDDNYEQALERVLAYEPQD